ncbi:MAG: hypothetical protein ACKO0M_03085, partial [Cyanobium sp.]
RFLEELAGALEEGPALEESQRLICAFLETFKRTYLTQISRSGIENLIDELDLLTIRAADAGGPPTPAAETP